MKLKTRAGLEDVFTIGFLLLLLGVLGVMGWYFADQIMTGMESVTMPDGSTLATINPQLHNQSTGAFSFMDGVIAFVLVLLIGGALALAFYSRGKTYLAIISVFIQVFFIIGGYFIRIFWQGFTSSSPALQAVALTEFPLTNLIMIYLPFISFITLIGIIILFFSKPKSDYVEGV